MRFRFRWNHRGVHREWNSGRPSIQHYYGRLSGQRVASDHAQRARDGRQKMVAAGASLTALYLEREFCEKHLNNEKTIRPNSLLPERSCSLCKLAICVLDGPVLLGAPRGADTQSRDRGSTADRA